MAVRFGNNNDVIKSNVCGDVTVHKFEIINQTEIDFVYWAKSCVDRIDIESV